MDRGRPRKKGTPECPVTGYAASTAYNVKGCRCEVCYQFWRKDRTLHRTRYRAKKAGIPHTLNHSNLPDPPSTCPALGIPLEWGLGANGRNDSPSLDRIVPELGYVPGNVVWISMQANRVKQDATVDELYRLADWLYEQYRARGIPCITRLRPERTDE